MLPPKPRGKPRPPRQPDGPEKLPPTENADIFAIQAVAKGIANEAQQKRAFEFIVSMLCETDRMTFWRDSIRLTDFAEGKRWVGVQLRRYVRLRPQHDTEIPPSNGE
jgi:hypothetical protein